MPEVLVERSDANYVGAFFSFLRVLAVAEASALLPLFVKIAGDDVYEYPTASAMVLAMVPAFLLTVINFFRSGEVRFGPPPNVVAEEA